MWRLQTKRDFFLCIWWLVLIMVVQSSAQPATLELEVSGEGSGGKEATIAQVEQQARADAMRKALEQAGVQLASVTEVDLAEVTRDEVTAWSRGLVRVVDVLSSKTIFDDKMKTFRCDVRLKVAVDLGDVVSLMSRMKQTQDAVTAQALAFEYRFVGFRSGVRGAGMAQYLSSGDVVQAGQEFQIWFKPDRDCYAYIINRDASGAVYMCCWDPFQVLKVLKRFGLVRR